MPTYSQQYQYNYQYNYSYYASFLYSKTFNFLLLQEDKNGFPEEISKIAGSVNINFSLREKIIQTLLQEILEDLKVQNHQQVMTEYKNRSNLIGKTVDVIENTFSGQSYQAQVVDITEQGHLLVKKKLQNSFEENLTELFTGEVSIKF